MTRLTSIGAVLLATLAVGAVATSVAQAEEAPFWNIGGTRLAAGQTHYVSAMVYKAGELTLEANTGQKVKCTKVKDSFESGVLLGSSAGEPGMSSQIFELSACKVEGDGTKCTKVSEPVVTKLLKAELVENESKENLLVEFKPASGAQLATLKFTAETGGSWRGQRNPGNRVGIRRSPDVGRKSD